MSDTFVDALADLLSDFGASLEVSEEGEILASVGYEDQDIYFDDYLDADELLDIELIDYE